MNQPVLVLDASRWSGGLIEGDELLLARCAGPTLDVGCGPGRLVAALHHSGVLALGLDVSPEAVRQTRRRGAPAIRGDIFGPVPSPRRWRTVLLADGNVGIGGDPVRLLRRCRELLAPGGTILAELGTPGEPSWSGPVVLHHASRYSEPFAWATVPADSIAALARQANLVVCREWTSDRRWFVELAVMT